MSNTTPAWKAYEIGATVFAEGFNWTITEVKSRITKEGRWSRVFTLKNDVTGECVEKTSRGITLWVEGGESKSGHDSRYVGRNELDIRADAGYQNLSVEVVGSDRPKSGDTLLDLIADAVSARVEAATRGSVDRDEVEAIVEQKLAGVAPRQIEVVRLDGTKVDVGTQHANFEALLRIVSARVNAWLVGPAGSGKTSAAHSVATALGLEFYAKSVGPQTSESSLLGYYDANGNYVRTLLREAFEFGGVFLLDEVDAGNPAVLVVINALLANGSCAFPDKVVDKHPDFVLIAGANTIGLGADRQYVGRQQIDAATLDRFGLLNWEYDPRIEAAAAGVPVECVSSAPVPTPLEFIADVDDAAREARVQTYVRKVVAIRNAVASLGKAVRVIVSPRASIHGAKLVRVGFSVSDTLDICVWKGVDADTRAKIEANIR